MAITVKKIFLHTCSVLGLFYVSRYLMGNKLLILCYHGFETCDESQFRPKLFIRKNTFENRLNLISNGGFSVLPLAEALDKLRRHTLPKNAIAITIDDGFYNVLNVAADSLNTHHYPATLYLTTYYVVKKTPIFRLAVQYMFWKTDMKEIYLGGCVWRNNKQERVSIGNSQQREDLLWECINYGENQCTESERVEICRQLGSLLGVDYQQLRESRILSLVTVEEAKELANRNFDIQLHTHRHCFPTDDEEKAKKEIADNREVLSQIVGYSTEHFCYPSGIWSQNQRPWLEQMDVKSATTCLPGLNHSDVQSYELKRFLDGENISKIEFKAELYGFMELIRLLKDKLNKIAK